jgi:hypothetical protein
VFPVLGILSCSYLMLNLPIITWVRFLVWLDIGMIIYWFYGRTHSPLVDPREAAARSAFENLANFVFVAGVLAVFNFGCITVLAYMTEFGLTTETIAKWHEIGVTAEAADAFGLKWLGVSLVVLAVGFGMRKASGAR